jgi:adenylate cyclase
LVLAELEVPSVEHVFTKPNWIGEDVTNDERFGNGSLARDPWCDWQEDWN